MGRIIIVTLLWSEIMDNYNTPDTMVEIVKVGHEIRMAETVCAPHTALLRG